MSGVAFALVSPSCSAGCRSRSASRCAGAGTPWSARSRPRRAASCVCAVVALVGREWGGELWPFALAGLLAPGGAQLLFVLGVREAGPARASVIAGAAPLIAVTIAVSVLDEPAKLPLVAGAVLIVAGGLALLGERERARALPRDRARLRVRLHGAVRDARQRRPPHRRGLDGRTAARRLGDDPLRERRSPSSSARRAAAQTGVRRHPRARGRRSSCPGLLWGASYAFLFEAFYRSRVSIVSPLVATESLFAVLLAVLLLRRTELVGRHLLIGAALVVCRRRPDRRVPLAPLSPGARGCTSRSTSPGRASRPAGLPSRVRAGRRTP